MYFQVFVWIFWKIFIIFCGPEKNGGLHHLLLRLLYWVPWLYWVVLQPWRPLFIHCSDMKSTPRNKELETILVLVLAMCIFYWFKKKDIFLVAAMLTGVAGLLIPALAKLIHRGWMKLAEGLGILVGSGVLTLIFVIIVIPLGWLTGKAGKSSIIVKPSGNTYYKERNHTYKKEDLENPW